MRIGKVEKPYMTVGELRKPLEDLWVCPQADCGASGPLRQFGTPASGTRIRFADRLELEDLGYTS